MAAKGFGHEATQLDDGDWEVMFVPNAQSEGAPTSRPEDPDSWANPIHYLDCTEMDPPEPMVQILAKLESMSEGEVMFALLGREPVFLFPELQARGHAWAGDFDAEGLKKLTDPAVARIKRGQRNAGNRCRQRKWKVH